MRTHRQSRKTSDGKWYTLVLGLERSGSWASMAILYPSDQWNAREAASHAKRHGAIDFTAVDNVRELQAPAVGGVPDYVERAAARQFDLLRDGGSTAVQANSSADELVRAWRAGQQRSRTRRVLIEAQVQELADSSEIPADVMAEIKKTDPHPLIAVFRVGREGISTGQKQRKVWGFRAIKELAQRISESVGAVIAGKHVTGNDGKVEGSEYVSDTGERRGLAGRIVHAAAKKVGDALEAIAYVHVTDADAKAKVKSGEYDICSIDANCRFDEDPQTGNWFIRTVNKFCNLVIASSRQERPGFAEAGLVATIQELAQEATSVSDQPKVVTKRDVLTAVEQLNLRPQDIFRDRELLECEPVKAATDLKVTEAVKAKDAEIGKLTDQVKASKAIQQKQMLTEAVRTSKHLADKGDKYREWMLAKIKVDVPDLDEAKVKAAVDAAIETELAEMTKFGIKFEASAANEKEQQQGKQASSGATPPAPSGSFLERMKANPLMQA